MNIAVKYDAAKTEQSGTLDPANDIVADLKLPDEIKLAFQRIRKAGFVTMTERRNCGSSDYQEKLRNYRSSLFDYFKYVSKALYVPVGRSLDEGAPRKNFVEFSTSTSSLYLDAMNFLDNSLIKNFQFDNTFELKMIRLNARLSDHFEREKEFLFPLYSKISA